MSTVLVSSYRELFHFSFGSLRSVPSWLVQGQLSTSLPEFEILERRYEMQTDQCRIFYIFFITLPVWSIVWQPVVVRWYCDSSDLYALHPLNRRYFSSFFWGKKNYFEFSSHSSACLYKSAEKEVLNIPDTVVFDALRFTWRNQAYSTLFAHWRSFSAKQW